jgi:hypothetical protein
MSLELTAKIMSVVIIVSGIITSLILIERIYKSRKIGKSIGYSISLLLILTLVLISVDYLPDSKIDNLQYIDWLSSFSDMPKIK